MANKHSNLVQNFVIRLALIFILVTLLCSTGCASSYSKTAKEKADEIRKNLYVPLDAVLLTEMNRDDALNYANGCTGVLMELVYGVNRPLAEIIDEYDKILLDNGWETNPAYHSKTEQSAFYQKGPEVNLQIDTTLTWASPPSSNKDLYATIYAITILYTLPSNSECLG